MAAALRIHGAWLFLAAVTLLGGCRTASLRDPPVSPPSYDLDAGDRALARALAYYIKGMLAGTDETVAESMSSLAALKKAAELDSESSRPRIAVFHELMRQGRRDAAMAYLKSAAREMPDRLILQQYVARMAEFFHDFALAEEAYAHIERLRSGEEAAAARMARVANLFRLDDADARALDLLQTGIPLIGRERAHGIARTQARQLAADRHFDRALACIDFILETADSDRDRAWCLDLRGALLEALDRPDAAVAAYRAALAIDATLISPAVKLARIEHGEDPLKARQTLTDALTHHPDDVTLRTSLASILVRDDDISGAVEHLAHAHVQLKESGGIPSSDFYLFLGSLMLREQRDDDATALFEEGLEHHPDSPILLNDLAYLWAERGIRLDRAKTMARRALEKEPENGAFLDTLGWVYYQLGQYQQALKWLLRANQKMPDDPVILDHVADALHALGRTPEAMAYWSRALAVAPENRDLAEKLRAHGIDPESVAPLNRDPTGDGEAEPEKP